MKDFKCGIEIHQQLDTNKLFCECPSILRSDPPEFEIKRKLHAVRGESGEIDIAAKFEATKDKEFLYQGYDTTCLVELDEEPPHEINKEALNTALHVALHLNCEIIPITQVMRKTVVDGSNTSGFQRTVLIARNGFLETSFGKVRISGINLEEDAARIVEKSNNISVYRLDRLGIPLIEIGTEPDIKNPEQAKETALLIGDILRSCKVKRGIGTIRQDVNISVEGHSRIEIKGFQDVKMFVPTINKEIQRQKKLLEINEELKKRKAKIYDEIIDLTEIFTSTESKIIKKIIDENEKILGFKLENFKGILGKELYENKRLGSEISDYAKTAGVSGLIHSDEDLNKYHFTKDEIKKIISKLKLNENDSFIIIAEKENIARNAISNAIKRAKLQLELTSIPEVRNANPDGSTTFLRPMPGAARMYPETDHPLLKISRDIINHAKATLPKLRSDLREELKSKGLNEEMVHLLTSENKLDEFIALLKIINDPTFIVKTMILLPKEISSKEKIKNIEKILTLDVIESVISAVSKNNIKKEDVKNVLIDIAKGKSLKDALKIEKKDTIELESEILNLIKQKPGLSVSGYMGLIMEKFKGKISGKDASEILNKLLKN